MAFLWLWDQEWLLSSPMCEVQITGKYFWVCDLKLELFCLTSGLVAQLSPSNNTSLWSPFPSPLPKLNAPVIFFAQNWFENEVSEAKSEESYHWKKARSFLLMNGFFVWVPLLVQGTGQTVSGHRWNCWFSSPEGWSPCTATKQHLRISSSNPTIQSHILVDSGRYWSFLLQK